jgi:hypothetical protein
VETAQEVRYSGVVVGRGVPIRERDGGGAFVVLAEPLPVGTKVTVRGEGGEEQGRVTEVIESANPDQAGMRIQFGVADQSAVRGPQAKLAETNPADAKPAEKPPVVAPPPAADSPPRVEANAAPAASEPPAGSPPAAVAGEAAPAHVPESDSTASAAVPGAVAAGSTDAGVGGSGKRRRRRR